MSCRRCDMAAIYADYEKKKAAKEEALKQEKSARNKRAILEAEQKRILAEKAELERRAELEKAKAEAREARRQKKLAEQQAAEAAAAEQTESIAK